MYFKSISFIFLFFVNISFVKCQKISYKNIPQNRLASMQTKINSDRNSRTIVNTQGFYDLTNALPQNFDKTGTVDYTVFIQKAILKNAKVIFPDFPILINDNGLKLISNSTLYFPAKSVLKLSSSSKLGYQILNLTGISNVNIYFPVIEGDKYSHGGKGGEWGMGISIKASNNILIYGGKVSKCWGDGLYVGALNDVPSKNVVIKNSIFDDNRRNGISIVSVVKCDVDNVVIANTFGAQPMAGLDIEPNDNIDAVTGININDIYTFNNGTCGILFMLNRLKGKDLKDIDVSINNHIDESSVNGVGFSIASKTRAGTKFRGNISIKNSKWIGNKNKGFYNYSTSIGNGLKFNLQSNQVIDNSKAVQKSKMSEYNVIRSKYLNN